MAIAIEEHTDFVASAWTNVLQQIHHIAISHVLCEASEQQSGQVKRKLSDCELDKARHETVSNKRGQQLLQSKLFIAQQTAAARSSTKPKLSSLANNSQEGLLLGLPWCMNWLHGKPRICRP